MKEIWKDVVGYEGLYQVSNLGRVRSLDREHEVTRNGLTFICPYGGKVLTQHPRQHGYMCVQLYGRGGHKKRGLRTVSVHRIVAEAFIPNPDGLPEVNHKDEDKSNNRADNLEWMSHIDNSHYGTAIERRVRTVMNTPRRTVGQFTKDGQIIQTYISLADMARKTGYGKPEVLMCIQGKSMTSHGYVWKYLD